MWGTLRRARAEPGKAEQAQLNFYQKREDARTQQTVHGTEADSGLTYLGKDSAPQVQTRCLQRTGRTHSGAPNSRAATRRKRGRRLGPGGGGGRSRPAQSWETLGASGHVSARLPFSKLQLAPGPAQVRRESVAGGGRQCSTLTPNMRPGQHVRAAPEGRRTALRESRALSGRVPGTRAPRPPPPK